MSYYQTYYQQKKHIYKERYIEQKRIAKEKEEIFREYGGEREYYKMKLLEWGVKVLKSQDDR